MQVAMEANSPTPGRSVFRRLLSLLPPVSPLLLFPRCSAIYFVPALHMPAMPRGRRQENRVCIAGRHHCPGTGHCGKAQ
jgi:hypothetical protein